MTNSIAISDEMIINKIYFIRGKKVIIDRDLAVLYGVETKRLKEAVRRNFERFPEDFMFELTPKEWNSLRSQFASLKRGAHSKYPPFAFTEYGTLMISSVLSSPQAIAVSIRIMRVFVEMREKMIANKDMLILMQKLEKRVMKTEGKIEKYEEDIQTIFDALKELMNPPQASRKRIGYRLNERTNEEI